MSSADNLRSQYFRKSVHAGGIVFLPLLFYSRALFVALFVFLLILYLMVELLDRKGVQIPFLSPLIQGCKRIEESGRLSTGALCLALAGIIVPSLFGVRAAAIGLAQAYLADTAASVVGGWRGRRSGKGGKTWMGTASFFLVAFLAGLCYFPYREAALLAGIGALVESLPLSKIDNLTVPLAVAAAAQWMG